jgi:hypothetical protein
LPKRGNTKKETQKKKHILSPQISKILTQSAQQKNKTKSDMKEDKFEKRQKVGTTNPTRTPYISNQCHPTPPAQGGDASAELLPSSIISIA